MIRKIISLPLILLIRFYQGAISPMFPAACRFQPTCSQYALEAIRRHGPLKGGWHLPMPPLGRKRLRPGAVMEILKNRSD